MHFPVVNKLTHEVLLCAITVEPSAQTGHSYRSFGNGDMNIDDGLFRDPETTATTISTIQALSAGPSPKFISLVLSDKCPPSASIAGASCGLAIALALLHYEAHTSPRHNIAATGMVQALTKGPHGLAVNPVDEVATKLHACMSMGCELAFPMANFKQLTLSQNWVSKAAADGFIGPRGKAFPASTVAEAYDWSL